MEAFFVKHKSLATLILILFGLLLFLINIIDFHIIALP